MSYLFDRAVTRMMIWDGVSNYCAVGLRTSVLPSASFINVRPCYPALYRLKFWNRSYPCLSTPMAVSLLFKRPGVESWAMFPRRLPFMGRQNFTKDFINNDAFFFFANWKFTKKIVISTVNIFSQTMGCFYNSERVYTVSKDCHHCFISHQRSETVQGPAFWKHFFLMPDNKKNYFLLHYGSSSACQVSPCGSIPWDWHGDGSGGLSIQAVHPGQETGHHACSAVPI